jgi:hypothetical protein
VGDRTVQPQGDALPGQRQADTSDNTQIYEGTNQIQRVVMAGQLPKG